MELFYCIIYLLVISIIIYVAGRLFPYKWINERAFPFRSYSFERNGKIYEKLRIKRWKTKLPDASVLVNKVIKKIPCKRIEGCKASKLPILVKETCKAEMTHVMAAIFGFYCCKIWKKYGWILSLAYFVGNMPFVIIQRYNRPRLMMAMEKAGGKRS